MMLSRIALRSTPWRSAWRTRTSSSGGMPAWKPAKTTRMPVVSCTVYRGSRRSAGSCAGEGNSTMSASPVCSAIIREPSSGTTLKITRSTSALSPQ
jgi:hypothetical protein